MAGNWRVIGHRAQVEWLSRALEAGAAHHAYLIEGPDGIGKNLIARRIAQTLNCEAEPDARPCLACRSCHKIEEAKHADVRVIGVDSAEPGEGAGHKVIRLIQIQDLQHEAYLNPFEGRYRVLIVDSAERMTREAANAFLKTLEEPPESVVIILLTAAPNELPSTIRSRCQSIKLLPVPLKEIEQGIQAWFGADPELAARLARRAGGCPGWAVAAVNDEDRFAADEEVADLMDRLLHAPMADRLREAELLAGRFQKDRFDVLDLLGRCRSWWRDVLVASNGCPELILHQELADRIERQAASVGTAGALQALHALEAAVRHLEENVQPRIALDTMTLAFPQATG